MKRRMLFAMGALCFCFQLWGQSALEFINSQPANSSFENIWIVRYEASTIIGSEVTLRLELRRDGQLLYEGLSNPIFVASTVQILDPMRLGLVSENFTDPNIGLFVRNANALPEGNYSSCVSVVSTNQLEATHCQEFSVKRNQRIRLLYLPNGKEIGHSDLPTFSWSFMSNIRTSNIKYKLTLCEMLDGQTKEDALLRNVPILSENGLRTSSFQYPLDIQQLKVNRQYAWAVEAYANDFAVAKSEVWMFTVGESIEIESEIPPMPYLELSGYRTGELLNIRGSQFNLKLKQESKVSKELIFEITDEKGRVLKSGTEPYHTSYGDNYVTIDLTLVKKLKKDRNYTLTVLGLEREPVTVEFVYVKS